MPDLAHTLQGHDLSFLSRIASAWGIELSAPDAHTARQALCAALLNPELVQEVVLALPRTAQQALAELLDNEGRLPWAQFSRRFGDVRVMGAARRDRERPDLSPQSPAEVLYYRALIGRAFLHIGSEPEEAAFLPDDLIPLLPPLARSGGQPLGRPATPGEAQVTLPASDQVLDHCCTLLAALRLELPLPALESCPPAALRQLLRAAQVIGPDGTLDTEHLRGFLEAPRAQALAQLASAWMESPDFNELLFLPGISVEGVWQNKPLQARQALLNWLTHLPANTWWSLAAFVSAVRERFPDFQRPAGDYDSWFIRVEGSDQFLRGFASWDAVDGALIRYIICGPLHWLGMLDLAAPASDAPPAAFKLSAWAEALWHGQPPAGLPAENAPLRVTSDGLATLPALTPRAVRYQVARFSSWLPASGRDYRYQFTPQSLERARQQGLRVNHLTALLRKHSASPLPPTLLQALERWEQYGAQTQIEETTLLRVESAEILAALRKTSAARFLGETLSPTVVQIKANGREAVARALVEIGYLTE